MLTLTFFGQACSSIKCDRTGIEIVSDPWFMGPAHLNSWHSYPYWNAQEIESIRARLDQATHIYLSHDHADHFDPELLRSLGRKTILVGNFRNERFQKELSALASLHEIRQVRHGEWVKLHEDLSVRLLLQQPDFRTDSMMLCRTPDATILNANDCGLDTALLKSIAEQTPLTIFMYTLNFMASGYPISYLIGSDPEFPARMQATRDQAVHGFRVALDILKPSLATAFAGPVTYGDPENDHLNGHPESIDWSRMLAEVRKNGNVEWPAPFSTIECTDGKITGSKILPWTSFPMNRKAGALPAMVPTREEILTAGQAWVERMSAALRETGQETQTKLYLAAVSELKQIESPGSDWVLELDLVQQTARWVEQAVAPYVQIKCIPAYLLEFLTNHINVDDILLSARARFKRDPDTFDSVLHNLMRYGGDKLAHAAWSRWAKNQARCLESLDIMVGTTPRCIPKFCPHEGESLEGAAVVDGKMICPRHRWTFDLSTGQCVAGDRSVNLYNLVDQPK